MKTLNELKYKNLGVFELLVMSYELCRSNLRLFSCLFLPMLLIDIGFFCIYLNPSLFSSSIFFLTYFINVLLGTIYGIAISIIVESLTLAKKTQLKVVLKQSLYRVFPLIILNIRFMINYFLRSLLLFIPGIIYAINNIFYSQAFILRNETGKSAFQHSRYLVKGNWWKLFFLITSAALPSFILIQIITRILIDSNNSVLTAIISASVTGLIGIIFYVARILLFLNLDFQKR